MTIGNYILLNLLVAILVDGVKQQQAKESLEEGEAEMKLTKSNTNLAINNVPKESPLIIPSQQLLKQNSYCSTLSDDDLFYSASADPAFAMADNASAKSKASQRW